MALPNPFVNEIFLLKRFFGKTILLNRGFSEAIPVMALLALALANVYPKNGKKYGFSHIFFEFEMIFNVAKAKISLFTLKRQYR